MAGYLSGRAPGIYSGGLGSIPSLANILDFPRLVWEVCSDQHIHKDGLRVQAYETSIVKLGNCILVGRHEPPRRLQGELTIVEPSDGYEVDKFTSDLSTEGAARSDQYERSCRICSATSQTCKDFKGDDKNAINEHSFAKGLAAYVNTDEFDSTLYSRKSKKRKTDTGSSPEGGGGPAGTCGVWVHCSRLRAYI